jgi:hypothetical protein
LAQQVVRKFAENDELFVDIMLLQQRGLQASDEDDWSLLKECE